MMLARRSLPALAAVLLVLPAATALADAPSDAGVTTDFTLERLRLGPNGDNPYYPLRPGHYARLEGEGEDGFEVVERTVLDETVAVLLPASTRVQIVLTRVVEEREWVDGALVEVARHLVAASRSGDVYQLGEQVIQYEDGEVVGHEGSWMAGVNGARPGLVMPQLYLLGARYSRGLAPGVSMDRAEHVEMGVRVVTAGGSFDDCVIVRETTPLEPDEEVLGVYAPGVGLVVDEHLRLVEHGL